MDRGEAEHHHFATILVKSGSEKNQQWILDLGKSSDEEYGISLLLRCFHTDSLLVSKGGK